MADPKDGQTENGLVITIRGGNRNQQFAPDITREGQLPGGKVRSDDAGVEYLLQRQAEDSDALDRRARERYGVPQAQGDQAPAPATPASPAPATPPANQPPVPTSGVPTDIGALGSVAADVARGAVREVVHAPAAALSGAGNAVSELMQSADSLATWLNDKVPLTIPIPKTGSRTVDDLLANPAKAIAGMVDAITPTAGDSVSAPVIKEVAQFLTGMWLGGKLLGIKPTGSAGRSLASGAVGDALAFDPNDENLSAFLQKVPALANPVTEFMATRPDDNEAVNRLRRAVEGLGLGVATDGLLSAFRAYRARKAAQPVETADPAAAALAEQKARYGELKAEDLAKGLGGDVDAGEAMVRLQTKAERAAAVATPDPAALSGAADDLVRRAEVLAEPKPGQGVPAGGGIAVNWARIATGDDVKVAMRELADLFKADIKGARRGRITQEETARLADELGMTVDQLMTRREGQALNAEQTLAARRLLTAATERTLATARAAAQPNAGPVELFAYRRAVATEAAVLQEVLAARAEAGRALNAWKIPAAAAGDVERSRAIAEALEATGGEAATREIARRHMLLAESGAPAAALHDMAQAAAGATRWQMVSEVWVNGLLSSPKTHLVNAASNTITLAQQVLERAIVEKVAALGRIDGVAPLGVAPGEAAAMMAGVIAAQKDAWRLMWMALRTGETGAAIGKVDISHAAAISAESFRLADNGAAQAVDFLGTVGRLPSRFLGASDEYFKAVGYRMELNAQAVRQATSEGLQGVELRQRVATLVANPPENLRLQAADAALYTTFTQHAGGAAEALVRLREKWPATVFVLPFIRTPVNIARYGFERTPLAPLVSTWRDDLAAGGARAQLAMARMATGTSIMLMAADYADRGLVSGKGPDDIGQREALTRQGWQEYSIRIGDKWVQYSRADPYGMLLGFAADMADINRRMEIDADKLDEFSELFAAGIVAVSSTTINKTYLKGIADFVWMLEDPKRRAFGYVGGLAGSMVPAGVNFAKTLDDPVMREHMRVWDYIQGRLPFFSEGLTPSRDLWGDERQPDSGYGPEANAINPWRVSRAKFAPIDEEMTRLGMGQERIDRKSMVEGVAMNFRDWPDVYDRYVVLAGNALKHPAWNLGARDYLDAVVEGRHSMSAVYKRLSDGPEGGKADFIRAAVRDYRKLAQQAILADPAFADFKAAWREQRDIQNDKRAPLEGVRPPRTPDLQRPMPPGAPPVQQQPGLNAPMRAP